MAIPTRNEFEQAAAQVAAILAGHWTFEAPDWAISTADSGLYDPGVYDEATERNARYTRAVWTAEAYILLFSNANARFDRAIFLHACGLGPKPTRKRHA